MERTSLCVACVTYGVVPLSLSVDPACRSDHEADALCGTHRARMTEGYCVLCGRREPWVSPWPDSEIGSCEPCFRELFGPAHAEAVALRLRRPADDSCAGGDASVTCERPSEGA